MQLQDGHALPSPRGPLTHPLCGSARPGRSTFGAFSLCGLLHLASLTQRRVFEVRSYHSERPRSLPIRGRVRLCVQGATTRLPLGLAGVTRCPGATAVRTAEPPCAVLAHKPGRRTPGVSFAPVYPPHGLSKNRLDWNHFIQPPVRRIRASQVAQW